MKTGDIVGGPVRHDYEPTQIVTSAVDSIEARHWALALHFSLLAGYVIPFAGLVIPICIWQIKKGEFPVLNDHGKNAMLLAAQQCSTSHSTSLASRLYCI